MTSGGDDTDIN